MSGPFCPQADSAPLATIAAMHRALAEYRVADRDGRMAFAPMGAGPVGVGTTLPPDLIFIAASLSVMSAAIATPLEDADYHARTQAILQAIEARVDAWLDADVIDIDTHRTGGLLELSFPNGSKIIINTQPPLQELWLAAKAGGFHFRYVNGQWLERGGREFLALLSDEASAQAGQALHFA